LDVENGLLLSPNVDSLFDKHLISFSDDGQMLLSNKITSDDLIKLGINHQTIIPKSSSTQTHPQALELQCVLNIGLSN
jgi:5-methylcytosine-specific restriction protein A